MLRRAAPLAGLFLGLMLVLAACGSSSNSQAATTTTTAAGEPIFGNTPSVSAKMICSEEASQEIAGSLGVKTSKPLTPKWANHVYSCNYIYPKTSMLLSVRELPTLALARQYFNQLGTKLGRHSAGTQLGEGTFQTNNESMVVLKDNKVLLVDASKLPANFGSPPQSRSDVALTVAVTVMGCWTGV